MQVDVLLGLQWGDEGKGKIVDYLANDYEVVARFQGGPNAGHTLVINGEKHVLHTIPSGIFLDRPLNLIGNGVVIDPSTLSKELDQVIAAGVHVKEKLFVANKAHLILPTHKILDAASEAAKGKGKIGSTLRGIGPTYMDKTGRNGLRVGDIFLADFKQRYQKLKEKHLRLLTIYDFEFDLEALESQWFEGVERLRSLNVVSGEYFINEVLDQGGNVLAEGAQGTMLDIEHGTYPYVTSSHTTSTGVCGGLGVAPTKINEVIGIFKAYTTRVGSGPFPTELFDDVGAEIAKVGHEFGATTGRPRRCGWLDMPILNYAIMLNGVTQLAITKSDVLDDFDEIKVATTYQVNGLETDTVPYDLTGYDITPNYTSFDGWKQNFGACTSFNDIPENLAKYIAFIEESAQTPINYLSSGPGREELIDISVR
ncbi:MAG: adenylosuccinate synthase [Saprospiraceae bacterium]|nr:adenylosuccinate synthase [Saprospiraceae bacterium]